MIAGAAEAGGTGREAATVNVAVKVYVEGEPLQVLLSGRGGSAAGG